MHQQHLFIGALDGAIHNRRVSNLQTTAARGFSNTKSRVRSLKRHLHHINPVGRISTGKSASVQLWGNVAGRWFMGRTLVTRARSRHLGSQHSRWQTTVRQSDRSGEHRNNQPSSVPGAKRTGPRQKSRAMWFAKGRKPRRFRRFCGDEHRFRRSQSGRRFADKLSAADARGRPRFQYLHGRPFLSRQRTTLVDRSLGFAVSLGSG